MKYETPEFKLVYYENEDIVRTSSVGTTEGSGEGPDWDLQKGAGR